jgi:hypothetical protein
MESSLAYIPGFSVKFFFQPMVKIGKSSKFIKNPVILAEKLIIMLTQFKFGHILA